MLDKILRYESLSKILRHESLFDWEKENYAHPIVANVFMTKIFCCCERRNNQYGGTASINIHCLELENAKDAIERTRTKGSAWTILETPAIAFASNTISLLICETDSPTPLDGYRDILFSSLDLRSINHNFTQKQGCPTIEKFVTLRKAPPAQHPFSEFESCSWGGQYPLSWSSASEKIAIDFKPIYDIIRTVSQLAQKNL